jgi:hypothetical protein
MKLNRTLSSLLILTVCVACIPAVAGAADEDDKCENARRRAVGKFVQCLSRKADTHYYETCVSRLVSDATSLPSAPDTACSGPRWVNNADGTVTDMLTGLRWEMKTNLDSTQNLADPHDADNIYNLTTDDGDVTDDDGTAYTDFLASLNAGAGFAGSNAWRLPTIAELYTLYVIGDCSASCTDPALGPVGTYADSLYWSTTSHELGIPYGRLADSSPDGSTSGERAASYHVRAVSGGFLPF